MVKAVLQLKGESKINPAYIISPLQFNIVVAWHPDIFACLFISLLPPSLISSTALIWLLRYTSIQTQLVMECIPSFLLWSFSPVQLFHPVITAVKTSSYYEPHWSAEETICSRLQMAYTVNSNKITAALLQTQQSAQSGDVCTAGAVTPCDSKSFSHSIFYVLYHMVIKFYNFRF